MFIKFNSREIKMIFKIFFWVVVFMVGVMFLNLWGRFFCCVFVFVYFVRCWCCNLVSCKVMSGGDDVGSV